MQGGLQSITNTTSIRGAIPIRATSQPREIVDIGDATRNTKTPSPNKVTIKIEPASGKENLTGTPQSSK
jgi:hypothetical protein